MSVSSPATSTACSLEFMYATTPLRQILTKRLRKHHEHLRTVRPQADCNLAVDGRHFSGGTRGFSIFARGAPAAGGLSDHLGVRHASGRKSGNHGLFGRDTPGNSIRENLR